MMEYILSAFNVSFGASELEETAVAMKVEFAENANGSGPTGNRKLTPAQVRAIRKDYRKLTIIAQQYGVTPSTISMVRNRRIWRDVK
jgi:hypothetical protein